MNSISIVYLEVLSIQLFSSPLPLNFIPNQMRSYLSILSFFSLTAIVTAQGATALELQITSGNVVGRNSSSVPAITAYLGIPFGISTAGENRFMAPKRYIGTKKTVKSTLYDDVC
jgi:hypothetical protein